jgi:thiamine biosynthesis lipoprotein ApbE
MQTTTAPAEARFRAMGSDVHVLVVDGPPDLLGRARDRVGELERRWSRFRPDSEISRLNTLAGSPVQVSPVTLGLVQRALQGARATGGRYDPTVLGDLLRAGYDRTLEQLGDAPAAGGSPLTRGYDRIVIDPGRVVGHPPGRGRPGSGRHRQGVCRRSAGRGAASRGCGRGVRQPRR